MDNTATKSSKSRTLQMDLVDVCGCIWMYLDVQWPSELYRRDVDLLDFEERVVQLDCM